MYKPFPSTTLFRSLAIAQADQIMTPTPETLAEDMPIVDAIRFFEQAEHRSYPVIDAQGRPIAIASRADALRWRQANLAEGVTLGELLSDGSMRSEEHTSDLQSLMRISYAVFC